MDFKAIFEQIKTIRGVEDLKNIRVTRERIEKIAIGLVVLSALSLLFVTIKTRQTLAINGGKISYTGQVMNHRLNGQGTLTYDNGDTYAGEFKNGTFEGQGTYTSHEGWTYTGEFKSGQADGQGTLTTEKKATYKGRFEQGIYKG